MAESGKVFLSWAGPKSRAVAEALRDWLPFLINKIKPWISSRDMGAGSRWNPVLTTQLQDARMGILCLTPEALKSQWLLFEAGALSKTVENTALVCPYAFEMEIAAISSS